MPILPLTVVEKRSRPQTERVFDRGADLRVCLKCRQTRRSAPRSQRISPADTECLSPMSPPVKPCKGTVPRQNALVGPRSFQTVCFSGWAWFPPLPPHPAGGDKEIMFTECLP